MKSIKLSDLHDTINALGGVATNERDKGYCAAIGDALDIIERLEPQSFDTLNHLWKGGFLTDGEVVFWLVDNELQIRNKLVIRSGTPCNPSQYSLFWQRAKQGEFEPYYEPPLKGSLAWAKQQDCKVCHERFNNMGAWVDFSKDTNSMLLDNKTAWESPIYAEGWSTYQGRVNCMLCGNEIVNKEDGPLTANGIALAHYECHGKYEGYHALFTLRESVES